MSSSDVAVSVRGLSKSYTIAHEQNKQSTLAETLLQRARHPFRRAPKETFWALKDVSFDIKKGEVVGIIGRNGAGKSTLLKILSRITEPTNGEIDLYGRVGSLLEVGTGFHPELTGRENIFLNGAILGMRKAEIARQFDAIVDFSGCEQFLDTPVKRYSSGMYVRLAFAVAAHLESEILIVDEVLAVGDAEFQTKCLGKMKNVASHGRTVLFVSHNMQAVQNLCHTALLLKRGRVAASGDLAGVIEQYLRQGGNANSANWERADGPHPTAYFQSIRGVLEGAQPRLKLNLACVVVSHESHADAFVAIDIADNLGVVIMQALPTVEGFIRSANRTSTLDISVDLPALIPGKYEVTAWLGTHNNHTLDLVGNCVSFEVTESPTPRRTFPHTVDHGHIVPASFVTCQPAS